MLKLKSINILNQANLHYYYKFQVLALAMDDFCFSCFIHAALAYMTQD